MSDLILAAVRVSMMEPAPDQSPEHQAGQQYAMERIEKMLRFLDRNTSTNHPGECTRACYELRA